MYQIRSSVWMHADRSDVHAKTAYSRFLPITLASLRLAEVSRGGGARNRSVLTLTKYSCPAEQWTSGWKDRRHR